MSTDVVIRPLEAADVDAAHRVGWAALRDHVPAEFMPAPGDEDAHERRGRVNVSHLQATDPDGCWVAQAGAEIVGVALALVREQVWGLSLLGVAPDRQGQGIGGRLLRAALGCAEGTRGGIILSSTDPRAMRRYARAGFRAKPCLAAGGQLNRARLPSGLRCRPGDLVADREALDVASRHVRGAAHGADLEAIVAAGCALLVLDGRGFAFHRHGSPALLAARDRDAAADLLWGCLAAAAPGASIEVGFITEGNDWAIGVALDAGLSLGPDGPVFVRGDTGPFAPYLPSGPYL